MQTCAPRWINNANLYNPREDYYMNGACYYGNAEGIGNRDPFLETVPLLASGGKL